MIQRSFYGGIVPQDFDIVTSMVWICLFLIILLSVCVQENDLWIQLTLAQGGKKKTELY